MTPMDQRLLPTNILYFLFHLNFINLVGEVYSINHAEREVTIDLCLNGKQKFEEAGNREKHTHGL